MKALYWILNIIAIFLTLIGFLCQWLFGFGGTISGYSLLTLVVLVVLNFLTNGWFDLPTHKYLK
ncbi:hypothetical protein [Capnocytophaga leadbetteri]|uniref:Uncharacterized protein n=1 Tax=Myoviridae sp. ct1Js5 TaxID=2826601 RepID=A0A8S5M9S2_9CAUD|nr:hypothetical protein [Capnocytophaga leadbetteri]DAD78831.1 MAG TPA: hypothetical protein [Myoviridae sp. ct1Js5]DAU51161.1 MAG TPA: hypothetical protein [Caudoviricetes sp.]DAV05434.1 MAG TPA: hypothetical protein [Caudoviricetes sp.]